MAVASESLSSSSILVLWRWACSPNPKYRIEDPGPQRKAEVGEPFRLYF